MTVHFIGAGPGAADLLTLRAVTLLGTSQVCLYAGTYVTADILAHCSPDAELIDTQHLTLDQIIEHAVRAHRAGHAVARLCSGDPSLYSALHEQTARLDIAGVPWDVTPGVPAYAAAAALLGTELTVPEVAQSVVLTRAQARSTVMPPGESLAAFAATGATLVLHLAITRIGEIAAELSGFYGPDCPTAVVFRATQPDEVIVHGTLATIAGQVAPLALRQAAVILVGPAVGDHRAVRDRAGNARAAESHLYSATRTRPAG